MADNPRQSNVVIRKISAFPDYGPDDFIEFITKEYGMVSLPMIPSFFYELISYLDKR